MEQYPVRTLFSYWHCGSRWGSVELTSFSSRFHVASDPLKLLVLGLTCPAGCVNNMVVNGSVFGFWGLVRNVS